MLYAHAHFSNERVIGNCALHVSCPGGEVRVAVTREFEHDICLTIEILQTIPNRAGVPRKSTKVPRPSFHVWAGRSGHCVALPSAQHPAAACVRCCHFRYMGLRAEISP